MTLENVLPPKGIGGWIKLTLVAFMWLNCTIGILCMMEVCSGAGPLMDGIYRLDYRVYLPFCMQCDYIGLRGIVSTLKEEDM